MRPSWCGYLIFNVEIKKLILNYFFLANAHFLQMQFLLIILVCADKAESTKYSLDKEGIFIMQMKWICSTIPRTKKNAKFFQNKQKVQIKRAKYAKNRHIEKKRFELVPPWKKSKKTHQMVAKHITWIKRLKYLLRYNWLAAS